MFCIGLSLHTIQLCLTIQTKSGFIGNEFLFLHPISKGNYQEE